MLATETIVPVYFAMEDDELLSIYTQTLTSSSSQGSLSAAEGETHPTPDCDLVVCIVLTKPTVTHPDPLTVYEWIAHRSLMSFL